MRNLETDRLLIRAFQPDDLHDFTALMDGAFNGGGSGEEYREQVTYYELADVVQARLRQPPYGDRAVVLKGTGALVGSVGFVLTPVDSFLFAGDVQWINWSATNGENRPVFSQNQSGAMPWDLGWSDQWVFKVGVQVAPTDKLRVRAGYNYGKMPLDPHCAFENLAFPAVSEHHFALGAGYDFGRLTLNAGASYSPKATLSGSNADLPANGGQAIQSYTTEMSQVAFDAGLTWRL